MHPSRWGRWQPGCAGDSSLSVRVAAARAHPHVRPPPCSQHSVGVSRAQSSSPQGPTCHLFPAGPAARAELHSPSPGQGRLLFRRHVARCTPRSAARTSKGRPEVFALLALLDSDKRGTRAVLRVPAASGCLWFLAETGSKNLRMRVQFHGDSVHQRIKQMEEVLFRAWY